MSWANEESDQPIVLPILSVPAVRSLAEIRAEDELSQLFPEAMFPVCPEGGDSLEGSMELLKKGLESGTVLIQFEVRGSQGLVSTHLLSCASPAAGGRAGAWSRLLGQGDSGSQASATRISVRTSVRLILPKA